MSPKEKTAKLFGQYLDDDNFQAVKKLLLENCLYEMGNDKTMISRDQIIDTYQTNMEEGHQKFDKMVWGKSKLKKLNEEEYEVYFSDFLTHKGITHNYQCKQKLVVNDDNLIVKITHLELPEEKEKLNAFYKKVGLDKK